MGGAVHCLSPGIPCHAGPLRPRPSPDVAAGGFLLAALRAGYECAYKMENATSLARRVASQGERRKKLK